MRIVSFAWTSPALVAGHKTVTRREWEPRYARSFRAGELVAAYNRSQRNHGVQIATIRLTAAPTFELMSDMPDSDYAAEGFAWFAEHPDALSHRRLPMTMDDFNAWRWSGDESMWVVRFELVSVEPTLPPELERWARLEVVAGG